ncbi:hypothetical protein MJG53_018487 [Ovis ammon polii x Ovis aries]|uniref:Uncharacterized protein n=1 Tax=Ovis ammon polii x Ovis aries TaxID=2918886 RepID=A0ACB9U3U5_9CETA|nr:hypothetical protein MJG53_018487 [Ovis ammon polii x Ovis aries]
MEKGDGVAAQGYTVPQPYRLRSSFCNRNDFEMKPVSLVCDALLLKASRLSLIGMKWVGKKTKCSEFGASVDRIFAFSALTFALWQPDVERMLWCDTSSLKPTGRPGGSGHWRGECSKAIESQSCKSSQDVPADSKLSMEYGVFWDSLLSSASLTRMQSWFGPTMRQDAYKGAQIHPQIQAQLHGLRICSSLTGENWRLFSDVAEHLVIFSFAAELKKFLFANKQLTPLALPEICSIFYVPFLWKLQQPFD